MDCVQRAFEGLLERRFPQAIPSLPKAQHWPSRDGLQLPTALPCLAMNPAEPGPPTGRQSGLDPSLLSGKCPVPGVGLPWCCLSCPAPGWSGGMGPDCWCLPSCPWGAPMALVPSPEGASIPCRYITGHPKWESFFLFYFRPRNEQGRCQSLLPRAGSVGHPGIAFCASGATVTCRDHPAPGCGPAWSHSCQTFSSQEDSYSLASIVLAPVLVAIKNGKLPRNQIWEVIQHISPCGPYPWSV